MTVPAGPAVRKNIVPLLGIAFVVAILCTGLFYGAFASRFTASATHQRHELVVAAHDLAAGAIVRRDDVRISEVQADAAPKGMISTPELVDGRPLAVPAAEGTPILEAMLSPTVADHEIPPGMRAMTIRPTDSSSIVGVLQPGRRIDIQAWSNSVGEAQLRTILNDVEVLNAEHGNADSTAPTPITVLVPVSNTDEVALADSAAHIRIVLRNSDDSVTTSTKAVGLAALFRVHDTLPAPVLRTAALPATTPATIPAMTVSVLGISEAGLRKLGPQSASAGGFGVRDLRASDQWDDTMRKAVAAREAFEMTAARIGGAYGDTLQFGNRGWHFRLRFERSSASLLWIEPEIVREAGSVITTQRTRGHVEPRATGATAVLIGGVGGNDEDRAALAQAGSSGVVPIKDLVIVMRSDAPALRASLPGAGK